MTEPAVSLNTVDENRDFRCFQEKVRGTNINEASLLATDYLNHFNEIVMLLDMIPDMPELLEDAQEWKPKSYQQFVGASTFSDRHLAVEAYNHVPQRLRQPFETTVAQLDGMIAIGLRRLSKRIAEQNMDMLKIESQELSRVLQILMERASAIIHGSERAVDQSELNALISRGSLPGSRGMKIEKASDQDTPATVDDKTEDEAIGTLSQNAIDALFD